MAQRLRILLVEDNPGDAVLVRENLADVEDFAADIVHETRLAGALARLRAEPFHVVLLDLKLPDAQGEGAVAAVLREAPQVPIVVLTGTLPETADALKALKSGVQDYLLKEELSGSALVRAIQYSIERKRAGIQLDLQAAALTRANAELKTFSYSVSHDLKAPLRRLTLFLDMARQELDAGSAGKARQYLASAESSARGMLGLIDSLMVLGRVSQAAFVRRRVDLSRLVKLALDELSASEPARKARFRVAPCAPVEGDETLLKAAVQNLLFNAWKFTAGRPVTEIEFGCAARDGRLDCFIRDNGIGFKMEDAARIFEPFERLHSQAEFPGSGIGLAIVKRAIERHGGSVRVEAAEGRGATFHFSLPLTAPAGTPEAR